MSTISAVILSRTPYVYKLHKASVEEKAHSHGISQTNDETHVHVDTNCKIS